MACSITPIFSTLKTHFFFYTLGYEIKKKDLRPKGLKVLREKNYFRNESALHAVRCVWGLVF